MPRVAFHTLGCKVNQYETEGVAELFKSSGYEVTEFENCADVYVINTCTVTNMGDRKSRQMISKARGENPNSVIAVMGCYAQTAADEVSRIPGVNLIIGSKDKHRIVDLVKEYLINKEQINIVEDIRKTREYEEIPITIYKNGSRAFVKIQDGCNMYCTYCIIPYARGPVRSRKLDDIMEECRKLSENGFKEIVLTGIHVESYGSDLNDNIGLTDVIYKISEIEGIKRIRLGSLEPRLITKEFLERLKRIDKFCPHFHLSLQSGCDETLKRMNRKYTSEEYKKSVDMLRSYYPDASVTTDLMVGFPGETEEEFEKSLLFASSINFSKIHVFKYSSRRGTPAAKFKDQIDSKVKEERSKKFLELSKESELKFYNKFLNTKVDVLFESSPNDKDDLSEGFTKNYIKVKIKGCYKIGEIKQVLLEKFDEDFMFGIVENFKNIYNN